MFIQVPVPGYRMLLCLIIALALLILDHRYAWMMQLRAETSTLVAPIQWFVSLPAKGFNWLSEVSSTKKQLVKENYHLQEQLVALSQRTLRTASLEVENNQLRALLKVAPQNGMPYISAELMMLDTDPYKQQIIINRGTAQKIYVGQPVIDAFGIVGQVVSVSRYTSRVLLVDDEDSALPVQVLRNGERFILQGNGAGKALSVENVPNNNNNLHPADILITSGLGGGFPAGYPVAMITTVKKNPNSPFAEILAQPIAHINQSRQFLLLFMPQTVVNSLGAANKSAQTEHIVTKQVQTK